MTWPCAATLGWLASVGLSTTGLLVSSSWLSSCSHMMRATISFSVWLCSMDTMSCDTVRLSSSYTLLLTHSRMPSRSVEMPSLILAAGGFFMCRRSSTVSWCSGLLAASSSSSPSSERGTSAERCRGSHTYSGSLLGTALSGSLTSPSSLFLKTRISSNSLSLTLDCQDTPEKVMAPEGNLGLREGASASTARVTLFTVTSTRAWGSSRVVAECTCAPCRLLTTLAAMPSLGIRLRTSSTVTSRFTLYRSISWAATAAAIRRACWLRQLLPLPTTIASPPAGCAPDPASLAPSVLITMLAAEGSTPAPDAMPSSKG
mmetsp:Transcript_34475/g.76601  ORF Transcript_34475/g.76601 Transcript_34475/m.76601 type:complete len:316 (-) Transcript_34475:821-1768(-)